MRIIKQGRKRGVTTTHQALVHIDDENWMFWQNLNNKSRFINECCKKENIRVSRLYCPFRREDEPIDECISDEPISSCLNCICYQVDDCPYFSKLYIEDELNN